MEKLWELTSNFLFSVAGGLLRLVYDKDVRKRDVNLLVSKIFIAGIIGLIISFLMDYRDTSSKLVVVTSFVSGFCIVVILELLEKFVKEFEDRIKKMK